MRWKQYQQGNGDADGVLRMAFYTFRSIHYQMQLGSVNRIGVGFRCHTRMPPCGCLLHVRCLSDDEQISQTGSCPEAHQTLIRLEFNTSSANWFSELGTYNGCVYQDSNQWDCECLLAIGTWSAMHHHHHHHHRLGPAASTSDSQIASPY